MTPDPVIADLARFSPSPPAVDRDEFLFRAGRASARVGRWKVAVVILAVTQVVSWGLWLTARHPRPIDAPPVPAREPGQPVLPVPPSVEPVAPSSYGPLTRGWDLDHLPPLAPAPPAGPGGPELSAVAGRRDEMLD